LIAVCTHLGCSPNWLPAENKFKCPCHGSGFYMSGVNFEGPAPRPLERARIVLADDGQILIGGAAVTYLYTQGLFPKGEGLNLSLPFILMSRGMLDICPQTTSLFERLAMAIFRISTCGLSLKRISAPT
jgi:hypothetical protein